MRKILAIDDNPTNLALLKVHVGQMGMAILLASNACEGIEMALNEKPDLILLDIMMPEIDGFEVCKRLKADLRTADIPIIFVSAKDQTADKIKGLELGAIDYVTKPFDPAELKTRINVVVRMTELQERLLAQANTDELTGLPNRRHYFEVMEREVMQAKLNSTPLSVIILDIDFFKNINDTYGHLGGDIVLKQLAGILKDNLYSMDLAARYGGEEFIILMPKTGIDNALVAAEKVRKKIEECTWKISVEPINITASFGVAMLNTSHPEDSYELVKRADLALYDAKRKGRNRVVNWSDVDPDDAENEKEEFDVNSLHKQVILLARQMRSQAVGTVMAFAEAMSIKDPYMAHHAENVKEYCLAIASELHLPEEQTTHLANAALLHDLGKLSLPNEILSKTTPLTDGEKKIIEQHPLTSARILSPVGMFDKEIQMIKHHQEKYDGSGYPDGLDGKKIPFGARILAVAVAFAAITSERWHRSARSCDEALDEIVACSGTQFDPDFVDALKKAARKHIDRWPLSTVDAIETVVS
ncbi:MAG: diguanylate cyclase [Phycisphaerae bacterium]|nr:diguanylate cyclase [Phycisphaerae bacterium]